jgi:type I restriction enzyme S subunit
VKDGWRDVTLGDIFDISSSKRVHEKDWKSSGVPFYRAREIVALAAERRVKNELFISEEQYDEYSRRYGIPSPGDLMVSAVGTLGACYVVQPVDRFYYKDASVLRFSPKQEVCSRFFQHAFRTREILDQVEAGAGSTVGTYTISRASQTRISVPPLPEQCRIAAILDKADELRAKRRAALEQLSGLTQSVFLAMFGQCECQVRLSDITSKITDGVHLKPDYTPAGVPFISVKDVVGGTLRFDDCKFISVEDHERNTRRSKAEKGDILYTKVGTYGQAALVDTDREFSLYVSVCLIKPRHDVVDSAFLTSALQTPAVKRQADRRIKGIGVPDLHLEEIRQFLIPLPSLEEQRQFSQRMAAVRKSVMVQRASLTKLDALFSSIQHQAFSGALGR